VFVHSLAGYNFWFGEAYHRLGAGRTAGETRKLAMGLMAEQCAMPGLADPGFWYARLTPRETAEMERCLVRAAARRVLGDPAGYVARFGLGIARFWFAADDPSRSRQYGLLVAPLLAGALLGAVAVLRPGATPDLLGSSLVLLVVLHNLAYAGTWPMARMSVQVYPAVAYLAGAGLGGLLPRAEGGR
jgi:hypothetical protein